MSENEKYGLTPPEEPKPVKAEEQPTLPGVVEPFNDDAAARYDERFRDSLRDDRGILPTPLRGDDWREHMAPERYPDAQEVPETYQEFRQRIINGGTPGRFRVLLERRDSARVPYARANRHL